MTVRMLLCGAVAVLVAALAVPAALAVTRPDDRAEARGAGAVAAAVAPTVLAVTRPDDRAGPRGAGVVTASVTYVPMPTADVIVRRIEAGLDPITALPVASGPALDTGMEWLEPDVVAPTPASQATADEGIDWSDPLVLAGVAALAAAVAVGITFVVLHARHSGTGTGRPAATH